MREQRMKGIAERVLVRMGLVAVISALVALFSASAAFAAEDGSSTENAIPISLGQTYTCQYSDTNPTTWYKVIIPQSMTVALYGETKGERGGTQPTVWLYNDRMGVPQTLWMFKTAVSAIVDGTNARFVSYSTGWNYHEIDFDEDSRFASASKVYYLEVGIDGWSPGVHGQLSFKLQKIGPDVDEKLMHRLYNLRSGEHFYTASTPEMKSLCSKGWYYEGIAWTAPKSSRTPVYRLYSGTDHHYTMSAGERDSLVKAGWKYEGVGWCSDDAKGVPLYRQYNPNVNPNAPYNNSGAHNYTTSKAEHNQLVSIGWQGESVGWYGCK